MKTLIKYSLVLLGLSLAVVALRDHLGELPSLIGSVDASLLIISWVGLLIYQFWNAGVWSEVLKAMGLRCKRLDCARIWLESESLKWLPGTVWSYGSRVMTAKKLGVNKKQASSSIVLELILTNIAWAVLAICIVFSEPVMSLVRPVLGQFWVFASERMWATLVAVVCVLPCVILGSRYLTVIKKTRLRQLLEMGSIDYTRCLKTTGHYVILCIWNASMMWVVFNSIPSLGISYITVLGIAGVAWMAGFWAIGIPGGLGVREAVIIVILSQYGPVESALLAAVLWRGLQMAAEIGALLISLGIGAREHLKQSKSMKGGMRDEEGRIICQVVNR